MFLSVLKMTMHDSERIRQRETDEYQLDLAHLRHLAHDEKMKRLVKEAISEWLDSKLVKFAWWSFTGLLSIVVAGLAYLGVWLGGHGR